MTNPKPPRTASADEFGRVFKRRGTNQSRWQLSGEDEVDLEDDNVYFVDPADDTKRIRFDAGNVTTATDRVITLPDYNLSLGSGLGAHRNVLASSGNLTMTAANSGSVMLLDAGAVAYVLPAVATADIGIYFDFFTTVTATAQTITAGAADLLTGSAMVYDFDAAYTAPQAKWFVPDVVDDLIITMNGTTTGGKVGSFLRLTAISATRWFIQGTLGGDGVIATPFS